MSRNTRQYLSDRHVPLLFWGPPPEHPFLTMECYEEWYDMFLIKPDGSVEKVDWSILEDFCGPTESAWHDHAPNPEIVKRVCSSRGWWLHQIAAEIMITRFNRA